MDRVVQAFQSLQDHKDDLTAAVQARRGRRISDPSDNGGTGAIPWLQGVENHEFRSPSKSISGTQLERMRGRHGERSPSPVTKVSPTHEGIHQQASPKKGFAAKVRMHHNAAEGSGVKEMKPHTTAIGTHGLHKWFPITSGLSSGRAEVGDKAHAVVPNTTGTDSEALIAQKQQQEDHTSGEHDGVIASDGVSLGVTQQLEAIMAGLEPSCQEQERDQPAKDSLVVKKPRKRKRKEGAAAAESNPVVITTPTTARNKQNECKHGAESPAPGDGTASSRRRIPARLLPWSCAMCTFGNKGGDNACEMCQTPRNNHSPNESGLGTEIPSAHAAPLERHRDNATPQANANTDPCAPSARHLHTRGTRKKGPPPVAAAAAAAVNTALPSGAEKKKAKKQQEQQPHRKLTGRQAQAQAPLHSKPEPPIAYIGALREKVKVPARRSRLVGALDPGKGDTAGPVALNKHARQRCLPHNTTWTGSKAPLVLLGSGLEAQGKEALKTLATACGATVVDQWRPSVTHVVCGSLPDSKNCTNVCRTAHRTFKYLMGVLAGKWIVSDGWVAACLASGTMVNEDEYEIESDSMGSVGGPNKGRTVRAVRSGGFDGLLKGFEIHLVGEFARRAHVVDLVKAAGGKIAGRLPTTGASGGHPGGVVLMEVPDNGNTNEKTTAIAADAFRAAVAEEPWYAKAVGARVPVVSHRWLTDSISRLEVCPMADFVV